MRPLLKPLAILTLLLALFILLRPLFVSDHNDVRAQLLATSPAAIGYLGLPFLADEALGKQLGQMAGMFLGLVCGCCTTWSLGSLRRSSPT